MTGFVGGLLQVVAGGVVVCLKIRAPRRAGRMPSTNAPWPPHGVGVVAGHNRPAVWFAGNRPAGLASNHGRSG